MAGWLVGMAIAKFGGRTDAIAPSVMVGVVAGFGMALLILKKHSS